MHSQLSRRQFVLTASIAAGAYAGSIRTRTQAAVAAKVDRRLIIPTEPGLYCGWPTLARLQNGELMAVWSGGREGHVCPFGRVESVRSSDGGETWTWPRVLLDGALDDRDAGVLETDAGTLLVTTFSSLAYEPLLAKAEQGNSWAAEKLRRWQSARDRLTAEQRQAELGCWALRSTDRGLTWSAAQRTPLNSPHGPIQLSDGRLLYAGKRLWTGNGEIGVAVSPDDGASWSWLAEIPTRPGDKHQDYHELHAVEASPRRLVVHIRNHNTQNSREILQTESTDGGRSWSVPHPIDVWGLPSHLMKLADGRLLMSYGYRRRPYGNQARVSDDEGRSWSAPLTISDDGHSGDLGYPSTVQLDDGSLVTLWYELQPKTSLAALRIAKWRLSES